MGRAAPIGLIALLGLLCAAPVAAGQETTSLKYKNKTSSALMVTAQVGGASSSYRVLPGKSLTLPAVDNGSCAHVRLARDSRTHHKCHDLGTAVKGACDMPNSYICLSRVTFPDEQLRITVFPEKRK